jgi:hypothetical protein
MGNVTIRFPSSPRRPQSLLAGAGSCSRWPAAAVLAGLALCLAGPVTVRRQAGHACPVLYLVGSDPCDRRFEAVSQHTRVTDPTL